MTRAMPQKPSAPPVDRTGRIATLAFGVFVIIGIIALIAYTMTHQNAPAAVSPAATQTATPVPRPSETPGIHFKSQGHPGHDQKDPSKMGSFRYNSDPPTSGMHFEKFTDALINTKPLPKYIQVHVLEHGNVLLQYNCTCPDIAGALAQIASSYNNRQLPAGSAEFTPDIVQTIEENGSGVIVAPYPGMKSKIALTAWTRLQTFNAIDQASMVRFINAYLTNQENAAQ